MVLKIIKLLNEQITKDRQKNNVFFKIGVFPG